MFFFLFQLRGPYGFVFPKNNTILLKSLPHVFGEVCFMAFSTWSFAVLGAIQPLIQPFIHFHVSQTQPDPVQKPSTCLRRGLFHGLLYLVLCSSTGYPTPDPTLHPFSFFPKTSRSCSKAFHMSSERSVSRSFSTSSYGLSNP